MIAGWLVTLLWAGSLVADWLVALLSSNKAHLGDWVAWESVRGATLRKKLRVIFVAFPGHGGILATGQPVLELTP